MNSLYRSIPIAKEINSDEISRFGRFILVGMIGTVLDVSLLMVLKSVGMNTLIASLLSFSAGTFNNFTLNRTWTFKSGPMPAWQRQLFLFTAVSGVGLLLNSMFILALEVPLGNWLNQPELGYLPAKVIATGLVLFWNYFANKFWTFRGASRM